MAAINAAWELIGEPSRRAAFDRQRALEAAIRRRNAETGPRRHGSAGVDCRRRRDPGAGTDRPARDRVARLDERTVLDRRWL